MEKSFEINKDTFIGACNQLADDTGDFGTIYLTYTDVKPKKKATSTQLASLNLWCRMCAMHLDSLGLQLEIKNPVTGQEYSVPWTGDNFKETVYKYILKAVNGLSTTTKQDRATPSKIADIIYQRYAENGVTLPLWPSNKEK